MGEWIWYDTTAHIEVLEVGLVQWQEIIAHTPYPVITNSERRKKLDLRSETGRGNVLPVPYGRGNE